MHSINFKNTTNLCTCALFGAHESLPYLKFEYEVSSKVSKNSD